MFDFIPNKWSVNQNHKMKNKVGKLLFQSIWMGMVVYAVIRLTNDSISGVKFWIRPWHTTFFELLGAILVALCTIKGIGYLIDNRFNKKVFKEARKQIVYEVKWVLLFSFLLTNLTANVFTAFTDDGLQVHDIIINNLVILQMTLLFFLSIRSNFYLKSSMDERLQNQQLKQEKIETELKYLKAQINPHFLFNALNNIYHQIDEQPQQSKKMVEQFSDLLRYQLYDCNQAFVSLDKEIQYLKDFIQIEKARKSDDLKLSFHCHIPHSDALIAPFLLQPLVENAFKYISLENPYIDIKLHLEQGQFHFNIQNNTSALNSPITNSSGIGLKNVQKRLQLLYPDHHQLQIFAEANTFEVILSLTLST